MSSFFDDVLFDYMVSSPGIDTGVDLLQGRKSVLERSSGFGGDLYKDRRGTIKENWQVENSPVRSIFTDQKESYYDLMALQGSKAMQVGRDRSFNAQLMDVANESVAYQGQVDEMLSSMESEGAKFLEEQTQLEAMKAQIKENGGSADSVGAYSQLAKSQMQNTNRILQNLSGITSPGEYDVDLTFTDPVTGQTVDINQEFDRSTATDSNLEGTVRSSIDSALRKNEAEIMSSLNKNAKDMYGLDYDTIDTNRQEYEDLISAYNTEKTRVEATRTGREGFTADELWEDSMRWRGDQQFHNGYTFRQAETMAEALNHRDSADSFAQNRALAELTGSVEGFSGTGYDNHKTYMSGTQMFTGLDKDRMLTELTNRTIDRFEIQEIKDVNALEDEFNRRRDTASRVSEETMRRNELNKMRTEQLAGEKRAYAQKLKQQQQEYASTLSSFGSSSDEDAGITFTDTRPS